MVSETKIDESFHLGQFESNSFNPTFKLNRNSNGGGIMLFALKDMLQRFVTIKSIQVHFEGLFKQVNLNQKL